VGPKVSKNDAAFGLVRNDGSHKPAFNAIKSLMQVTTDLDGKADLKDLPMQLSGETNNVHHLLARRSDGTYLLFIWDEESSFDPDKKEKQQVQTRNVTFSSPARFRTVELLTLSDQGEIANRDLNSSERIDLKVTDSISVLRLRLE